MNTKGGPKAASRMDPAFASHHMVVEWATGAATEAAGAPAAAAATISFFGSGLASRFLNIDRTFEERTFFDHDALGEDVAGQDGGFLEFHAIGAADIAFHPTVDRRLPGR